MVKYNILLMLICIVSVPSFGLSWGIAQKKSSRKTSVQDNTSTKKIMEVDHDNTIVDDYDDEYPPSDEDILNMLEELLEMPKDERVALMEVLKILDEEDITDSQSRSDTYPYSWKDISISIVVASVVMLFFMPWVLNKMRRKRNTTTFSHEEEREIIREYRARLAEKRATSDVPSIDDKMDSKGKASSTKGNHQILAKSTEIGTSHPDSTENTDCKSEDKDESVVKDEEKYTIKNELEEDESKTNEAEALEAKKKLEARQRHEKAIAKVMAAKQKRENQTLVLEEAASKEPTLLTVYLLMTSSSSSPRLELSIPDDISAVTLIRRVSGETEIPQDKMKLIFCGRVITENIPSIVDNFGIVNGSTLHVVGKPKRKSIWQRRVNPFSNRRSENVAVPGRQVDRRGLVERAEEENPTSNALLHKAAREGDLETLRKAVAAGEYMALHHPDSKGYTCLHEAILAGHIKVVKYLLYELNADATVRTNEGELGTPLLLATRTHGSNHPITQMIQSVLRDGPFYDE